MNNYIYLTVASLLLLGGTENVFSQYDEGTTDLGSVTIGATNSFITYWDGGVSNGYEFMQSEIIDGSDAADFFASPNYTGSYLSAGSDNPFTLGFTPSRAGVETATIHLSVLFPEPYGVATYTYHLVGTGISVVPEPTTWSLLVLGIVALLGVRRLRSRS